MTNDFNFRKFNEPLKPLEIDHVKGMVWTLLSEALSHEYRNADEWVRENDPITEFDLTADGDCWSNEDVRVAYREKAIDSMMDDIFADLNDDIKTAFKLVILALVGGPYTEFKELRKEFVEARQKAQRERAGAA